MKTILIKRYQYLKLHIILCTLYVLLIFIIYKTKHFFLINVPVESGRKLYVHKTFRTRPERLLNVLCTFNLRPVSTG